MANDITKRDELVGKRVVRVYEEDARTGGCGHGGVRGWGKTEKAGPAAGECSLRKTLAGETIDYILSEWGLPMVRGVRTQ